MVALLYVYNKFYVMSLDLRIFASGQFCPLKPIIGNSSEFIGNFQDFRSSVPDGTVMNF